VAKKQSSHACAGGLPPSSFVPSGSSPLDGAGHIRGRSSSSPESSLQMPSQTHSEVSFTDLLGGSQSNQVDNQD
jgi:hypothetical protein